MSHDRQGYFDVERQIRAKSEIVGESPIERIRDPRVVRFSEEIGRSLVTWLAGYPSIPTNRIQAVALTYAATWLEFGLEVALPASQVTILLFSLDDIVDGAVVEPTDEEAECFLQLCHDLTGSRGQADIGAKTRGLSRPLSPMLEGIWFDTARALQQFCRVLSAQPGAAVHYDTFARMFQGAMEGMLFEVRSRRENIEHGQVPSFEEYLKAGRLSIASPIVCATAFVMLSPLADSVAERRCRADLDEFMLMGGACVRLANDARSFAREVAIEQRPNSMMIFMRTDEMSEREAEREVVALAAWFLSEMADREVQLPPELEAWSHACRLFTRLMHDWYMLREFH